MRKLPAILAEMVAGGVSPATLFHETIETAFVGMLMLDLREESSTPTPPTA